MEVATLAGMIRIDLRSGPVLRLCDGGVLTWGADSYAAHDPAWGGIGGVEALSEGVGDEIPALGLTIVPVDLAATMAFCAPGNQGSRVRFWIGEVIPATGAVTGTPELMFDGQLDTMDRIADRGSRVIEADVVSTAERLFSINEGNYLNPRFHKLLWPGETGEDNAIGLGVSVAWGAANPTVSVGGGFDGFGGGGGGFGRGGFGVIDGGR